MVCANDDLIVRSLLKQATDAEHAWLEEHLDECEECRFALAHAAGALLRHTATARDGKNADDAGSRWAAEVTLFPPGTRVDRYTINSVVGVGGAGVVYRADDPELQRSVALKLIRPDGSEGGSDIAQSRLLREARAMARLSHPNVVAVHDVGVHENQVFVVMDLVEGKTLAEWLRSEARPWQAILDVFLQAGRGLAAAHAAGLVHRDFKPDNVLMGDDDRVWVTDFGLARPAGPRARRADDPDDLPAGLAADARSMDPKQVVPGAATVTSFAGTPAYMAPEQLLGRNVDPKTDQFSFCVSLYIALYGRHPFGLSSARKVSLADMAARVIAGDVEPAPPVSNIPAGVRDILVRGLSRDPDGRHPSLERLFDELERFHLALPAATTTRAHPRWRHPLALAAVLIAIATVVLASSQAARQWLAGQSGPCGNGRVDPGEACDDGNAADDDDCLPSCRFATCGDGKVRAHVEECDDGNTRDNDGCSRCLRCNSGDVAFTWSNGHCYSRHAQPVTWAEARDVCARAQGNLVTYSSVPEWEVVRDKLIGKGETGDWIGLSSDHIGRLEWVTGEPWKTVEWGEPALMQFTRSSCALTHPTIAFDPAPCDSRAAALCEQSNWIVRPTDNHAYVVHLQAMTWPEARAACESQGAHLATAASAEEHGLLAANVFGDTWLGATDQGQEGKFRWVTGEPFSFSAFAGTEPDEGTHSNCLLFGMDKQWHDRGCGTRHAFICEVD